MKQLLIFGSGGHAKVVVGIVEKAGSYQIIGIILSKRGLEDHFLDYKDYGEDEIKAIETRIGIVAIGDNWIREESSKTLSLYFQTSGLSQ